MIVSRAEGRLQRRQFLRSVGVGLASVTAVACGGGDDEPIEPPPPEVSAYQDVVERYFGSDDDFDNAAFIGRHYVSQEGMSSSEAYDSTSRTRDLIDEADSESDAVDQLEERLQTDFVDVKVRAVDGWTLSRTEVDLCVLAYLLDNLDAEAESG